MNIEKLLTSKKCQKPSEDEQIAIYTITIITPAHVFYSYLHENYWGACQGVENLRPLSVHAHSLQVSGAGYRVASIVAASA